MLKDRTLIIDCNHKVGQSVKIYGWVQTKRDHGKITFLDLLDRSGVIQVVLTPDKVHLRGVPQAQHHLGGGTDLHPQDVICIEGKIAQRPKNLVNPNLETGSIELQTDKVEILSKAANLPFDMGGQDLDLQLPTLLDYRSLTLRHPKIKAIFKVQETILEGFRKACQRRECVEVVVPTIAVAATEGGAEVFKVDYYEHEAYLTQSPQLYKQMLVPVFERVWTVAHAYRAEPSVTTRHLSETIQMDCEFGFIEFEELLDLLEGIAVEMLQFTQEQCQGELTAAGIEPIAFGKIPRLTLREAQEIIFKEFGRDSRQEDDLVPQDEVDIGKWAREKYHSDLVTITHFPTNKRAFYTMPDPQNPEYSLSYDLLFRGLEILSGSQRIHDYDQLVATIQKRGLTPKDFEMYLQAFQFGMPPEGGFSFGLERLTKQVLMLENIREGSLYPRDMERVDVRLTTLKKSSKR